MKDRAKRSIRIRIRSGDSIIMDSTAGYLFYTAKYCTDHGRWFTILDGSTPNVTIEVKSIEIPNYNRRACLRKLWGRISGKKSKTN